MKNFRLQKSNNSPIVEARTVFGTFADILIALVLIAVIREFVANNTAFLMSSNPDYSRYLVQFCLIVVATLPILVAFPFFLNTIEKGALTGGVKE